MLSGRVIPFKNHGESGRKNTARSRTVVQVGQDGELLRLRARIIGCAGYTVHSLTPDQVTAEIRKARGPRVWVFCQTLDFYELALLAVVIRHRHPADKLLRLTNFHDFAEAPSLFDGLLEPITGVDDLLRAVAALAPRPSVRKTV